MFFLQPTSLVSIPYPSIPGTIFAQPPSLVSNPHPSIFGTLFAPRHLNFQTRIPASITLLQAQCSTFRKAHHSRILMTIEKGLNLSLVKVFGFLFSKSFFTDFFGDSFFESSFCFVDFLL